MQIVKRTMLFLCLLALPVMASSTAKAEKIDLTEFQGYGTVAEQIKNSNGYRNFARALELTGLDKKLAEKGPYTVLLPSDAAFGRLRGRIYRELFMGENRDDLKNVISYHIIPGYLNAETIRKKDNKHQTLKALNGETIDVEARDWEIVLFSPGQTNSAAEIERTGILAGNGIIHVIDEVLIPSGMAFPKTEE